jgi:hypothetical protein
MVLATISRTAINNPKKYILWLFAILIPIVILMVVAGKLPSFSTETKFLGLSLVSNDVHAVGWIAIGEMTSLGVFAFGGAACGVFAIGGVSCGLFSVGGLAIGLIASLGGGSLGFYSMGGFAIGGHAFAGNGVAKGLYTAEGTQSESIIGEQDPKQFKS